MTEFYIPYDGQKIHAKLEMPDNVGAKCPLAIINHGFTGHMEEPQIVAVKEAIRAMGIATLRVDLYGHGKSSGTFKEHTLFKWIEQGLAVIEYAKKLDFVTDLYYVGHSQGGMNAMMMGGLRPDDLKALVLLAPAGMIPDAARAGNLASALYEPDEIPEELVIWGGEILGGNYARTAQLLHTEDAIEKYHGPVLIVHGTADRAVPYAYAKKAAELYENCKLVTIPGSNHGFEGYYDEMTSAVTVFLRYSDGDRPIRERKSRLK
ncbi:MAG: alpha/beta fold hydrolase [Firmicutes bacterium]|nr:alpha/beta fold hydrolase [Bacillota bacterium]